NCRCTTSKFAKLGRTYARGQNRSCAIPRLAIVATIDQSNIGDFGYLKCAQAVVSAGLVWSSHQNHPVAPCRPFGVVPRWRLHPCETISGGTCWATRATTRCLAKARSARSKETSCFHSCRRGTDIYG